MWAKDIEEQRSSFYLETPSVVKGGVLTAVVLAAVGVVAALTMAPAERIWTSVLLNFFFLFSLALGGMVFSSIQDLIGASWGRPVKRIHEAFASFLPLSGAVLAVFLVCILFNIAGARNVYSWMRDPGIIEHFYGKNMWLIPVPFAVRNLLAIAVIVVLAMWQLRMMVARDLASSNGDTAKSAQLAAFAKARLRHWNAPILFIYAICYSLLGFDLLMSLSPLWFSTLWGAWLFAIMMQTLMATLLTFMFALRDTNVGKFVQRKQFHDVGKLMHGFTIFFAYLTYAHVLTYWFGNMPEETEYFIERMQGPWFWIIVLAPIFNFIIPLYTLIFKAAKWTPSVTLPLCAMILISQWFVYVIVVLPSAIGHEWGFFWLDFALLAGAVGLFVGNFFAFAKRVPMLCVGDPDLKHAYSDH